MGFPSLRTAQFGAALVAAGHDVRIALLVGDDEAASAPRRWRGPRPIGIEAVDVVRTDRPEALDSLGGLRREFEPAAVVTAGPFLPLAMGAATVADEPLWVDVPGDPMAEAQARAAADGSDAVLARYHDVYSAALRRGDAFSAVSDRQRAALLGALGAAGRLVGAELGAELVHVVRGSVAAAGWVEPSGDAPALPDDAVGLLFSGGWNTWLDHETMLAGVLAAMDRRADLHFLATGGAVTGHHDGAYAAFRAGAEASAHADRFHFLGWVDAARLPAVHAAAEVAVCVDRRCAEAELGARTRLLDAVEHGLRVAATVVCEQTEALRGAPGFTELPPGDAAGIADALVAMPRGRVDWDGRGEASTDALVAWAAAPRRAAPGFDLARAAGDEARALRAELDAVHATPTWKLLSKLRRRLGG